MKKIIAIVEARMTSGRLPGKVLMEAHGMPMLEILAKRLQKVKKIKEIVVATTKNDTDNVIIDLAKRLRIGYFRGSEEDVLSRVLGAAKKYRTDIIVEITGDCPLIDPEIVSQVLDLYLLNNCDYVCNIEPVTFPIGMDVQIFSTKILELADKKGKTLQDREHVSWYIRRNLRHFSYINLPAPPSLHLPELGLTLDERQDFFLIKNIVEFFYPDIYFSCNDILKYLRKNPKLFGLNKNVIRKEVVG